MIKLLFVDDSVTIQKVVELAFENENAILRLAGDGEEAYNLALEERPDLVIADASMPGTDGFELCRMIKTTPGLESVPVYILTSDMETLDKEKFKAVGADGHITKPFKSEELVKLVLDQKQLAEPIKQAKNRPTATSGTFTLASGMVSSELPDDEEAELEVETVSGQEPASPDAPEEVLDLDPTQITDDSEEAELEAVAVELENQDDAKAISASATATGTAELLELSAPADMESLSSLEDPVDDAQLESVLSEASAAANEAKQEIDVDKEIESIGELDPELIKKADAEEDEVLKIVDTLEREMTETLDETFAATSTPLPSANLDGIELSTSGVGTPIHDSDSGIKTIIEKQVPSLVREAVSAFAPEAIGEAIKKSLAESIPQALKDTLPAQGISASDAQAMLDETVRRIFEESISPSIEKRISESIESALEPIRTIVEKLGEATATQPVAPEPNRHELASMVNSAVVKQVETGLPKLVKQAFERLLPQISQKVDATVRKTTLDSAEKIIRAELERLKSEEIGS